MIMERDMIHFKHNSIERGLCGNYSKMWDKAKSKEQLIQIATDSNGMPYMCESIDGGWGLSVEYIKDNYSHWCSGIKIHQRGYTSAMLCGISEDYHSEVTELLIIGCKDIKIFLSPIVSEIYVCGNSNVEFVLTEDNSAMVHLYGNSRCNNCIGLNIIHE